MNGSFSDRQGRNDGFDFVMECGLQAARSRAVRWILRIASVAALVAFGGARSASSGVELTLQGEGGIQRVRAGSFRTQADQGNTEKILKRDPEGSRLELVERSPETGEIAIAT